MARKPIDRDQILPPLVELLERRPELAHRGYDWDRTSLAGVLVQGAIAGV